MNFPWQGYFDASAERGLNPFYERDLSHCLPEPGHALEIGAGLGFGVEWLLAKGFTVDALEPDPRPLAVLERRFGDDPDVRIIPSALENAELGRYELAVAAFSLFFVPPDRFECAWTKLAASLVTGGVFAGQMLGPEDSWRKQHGLIIHTMSNLEVLLEPFTLLHLEEQRRPGRTIQGEHKHWHVYHIVAEKR